MYRSAIEIWEAFTPFLKLVRLSIFLLNYKPEFYELNNLRVIVQFRSNRLACEMEEKRKLYYYPALPENLKRPESERLILPVGNCKTQ